MAQQPSDVRRSLARIERYRQRAFDRDDQHLVARFEELIVRFEAALAMAEAREQGLWKVEKPAERLAP